MVSTVKKIHPPSKFVGSRSGEFPRADLDNLSQYCSYPLSIVCVHIHIKHTSYNHYVDISAPDPRNKHFENRKIILLTTKSLSFFLVQTLVF